MKNLITLGAVALLVAACGGEEVRNVSHNNTTVVDANATQPVDSNVGPVHDDGRRPIQADEAPVK